MRVSVNSACLFLTALRAGRMRIDWGCLAFERYAALLCPSHMSTNMVLMQTFKAFHANGHVLQQKLMGLIAISLGLSRDYFEPFISEKANNLRLLHYPVRASADEGAYSPSHLGKGAVLTWSCIQLMEAVSTRTPTLEP